MSQVDKLLKVSLKEIRDIRLKKEVEEKRIAEEKKRKEENRMAEVEGQVATSDREFTVKGISFKMIYVEGGAFRMGATREQGKDAKYDEKPAHLVTLSSYHIGETPVTQALWKAVMRKNPSGNKGDNNLPVEQVSWYDCQEFIQKLNQLTGKMFRLPTEAEWEYAARGGKHRSPYKYAGSNSMDEVAWCDDNRGDVSTHPVKTKKPNALGIYDMSGNVCEWCQDWYTGYSGSAQTNPKGPSKGSRRVMRGDGWRAFRTSHCRTSGRCNGRPDFWNNDIGFRLAL